MSAIKDFLSQPLHSGVFVCFLKKSQELSCPSLMHELEIEIGLPEAAECCMWEGDTARGEQHSTTALMNSAW